MVRMTKKISDDIHDLGAFRKRENSDASLKKSTNQG